ncbi:MAG: hypothetical protein DFNUSKGM_001339 [Candidatus Fervidibacter sacchari]
MSSITTPSLRDDGHKNFVLPENKCRLWALHPGEYCGDNGSIENSDDTNAQDNRRQNSQRSPPCVRSVSSGKTNDFQNQHPNCSNATAKEGNDSENLWRVS